MVCAFCLNANASNSADRKFMAYPNPVERNAILTIEMPTSEHGEITVYLFNAVGRPINTIKTTNRIIEINAPDISGVYLLRIVENQKVVAVEKIIVKE